MSEDSAARRKIADRVVALALEAATKTGINLEAHWDDCSMDEYSFWIHLAGEWVHHGILTPKPMRVRSAILRWRTAVRQYLETTQYQGYLTLLEAPVKGRDGYYDQRLWRYRLDLYGGPGAVFVSVKK